MKLENLPNDILRRIAKSAGRNVGRLNVALVGSTRARSVIENQKIKEQYKKRKQNKKFILNFQRKLAKPYSRQYGGRGHFNRTMPGVYKNKKWKYFYYKTYYDPRQNMLQNITLFYNNRNGSPVFIHPITGVRKPVKNERKYLGNISINRFYSGLNKRSRFNYWPKFVKKATRYMSRV